MGNYYLVCDTCKVKIPTFKWDDDKTLYNEEAIIKFLANHTTCWLTHDVHVEHKLRHITDRVASDDPADNYKTIGGE